MALNLDDLDPDDAPSPEAWWLLTFAKKTPDNETEFLRSLYSKLLPSRQQIEREEMAASDMPAGEADMVQDVYRLAEDAREDPERPNGSVRASGAEEALSDEP
jgi:hypothetical protein